MKGIKGFISVIVLLSLLFSGCHEPFHEASPIDAIAGTYQGVTHRVSTHRTAICDTTYALITTVDSIFQSNFTIIKVNDNELSFDTPFSTHTFLYNASNHYEAEAPLSGPYLKRFEVDVVGDSVYTYYISSSARLVHSADTCQQIEQYAQSDTFAGLKQP